jgi:hypothetical protein
MSDTGRRSPRLSRQAKYTLVIFTIVIWTGLANTWTSKGCDLVPQSYALVIGHWTPSSNQGCETGFGGPQYTDNYQR